jgi:hypothetical protein
MIINRRDDSDHALEIATAVNAIVFATKEEIEDPVAVLSGRLLM